MAKLVSVPLRGDIFQIIKERMNKNEKDESFRPLTGRYISNPVL